MIQIHTIRLDPRMDLAQTPFVSSWCGQMCITN